MLKTLIKKEFLQAYQTFFFDRKKKTLKSKKRIVVTACLLGLAFLCCAFAFFGMGWAFSVFLDVGMDWLFFSLSGLIATVVGVVIDVIGTFNLLYKAKDNDLLLSMPITPHKILFARLLNTFVSGVAYESIAFVPFMLVYWIVKPASVMGFVLPIICWLTIGLFVTVLSCFLGWVIALISSKIKNRNFVKVFATLAILSAYYVFYFKAINSLNDMLAHQDQIASAISGWLFLSYHLGLGASGNLGSLGIFVGIVFALFAITYYVMSKTYIKLVTTNKGSKKAVYKKQDSRKKSVTSALIAKEARRFTSCSTYMLNGGLGLVIMIAAAVFLLIKKPTLVGLLAQLDVVKTQIPWIMNAIPVACAVLPMMITCMDAISASSVSLEGKNVWILQSCPIDTSEALKAKVLFHFILCSVPTLILTATLSFVLNQGLVNSFLICLFNLIYLLFVATVGVCIDLDKANINWTNEVYPIKQGFAVTVIILGGWGVSLIFAGLFFLLRNVISGTLYIALLILLVGAATVLLYRTLIKNGHKKFMSIC